MAEAPGRHLRRVVAVFGASTVAPGTAAWEEAALCGRLLAEADLAVATGGYGGAMEAVSSGAASRGGHVIGVTAPTVFPERSGANPFVVEEIAHSSITERIHTLVSLSGASIVLPGSIGTLSELIAAWNTAFVARFAGNRAKPVVTVGAQWRVLVDHLAEMLETDRTPVTSVTTVREAVAVVTGALHLG